MPETILIVDDEAPIRQLAARLARSLGLVVVEAADGKEGLARAKEEAVDLVLSDLKMPEMDGLTMARHLLEADPDRPVLLMTAFGDLDNARKAVGIGIYEYFTKPFDMNDMAASIKRALEHRRLVLENRAYQRDLERKVEERTRELRLKVKELQARDELLSHMLSLHEPEETLALAVRLAAGLAGASGGALYLLEEGGVRVGAAEGFGSEPAGDVGLARNAATKGALADVTEGKKVEGRNADALREGLGFGWFSVMAVGPKDETKACLELDWKLGDPVAMESLQGFLSYVAMAVQDCRLQESMPEWGADVEGVLKASEVWGRKAERESAGGESGGKGGVGHGADGGGLRAAKEGWQG